MIVLELGLRRVNPLYVLLGAVIMIALSLGMSNTVSAHGYVEYPESRALLCKEGVNKDCGGVQYEPQSVEGPGEFPTGGVPDGQIAGGGVFPKLDEQSEDRWAKVGMSSGANTFTWKLSAAHATREWKYFITKNDWDPNSPLERSDFEEFCYVYDGGKRPDFSLSHDCEIPERTGYHVILAYWEVADTPNGFYQVIDANFDGDFIPPVDGGDNGDNENGNGNDNGNGNETDAAAYNSNKVYLGGDEVTHNGNVYRALWWTQGQEPGTNSVWVLVSEGNEDGDGNENGEGNENENGGEVETPADTYSASQVYVGGDTVVYNGNTYRAAWWTLGENPATAEVWVLQ